MTYIQTQAIHLNIPTPCITFDQPLWLKAVEIIKAKEMNIVCRLGGFHTLMSFLGSIGSMMKGSGLEESLEKAYGPNAINHILSGKAFSRALRAHFLVEAALVNKLILAVLGNPSIETLEKEGEEEQSFSSSRDIPIISNETELAISLERQADNQDLESVEDKLGGTEIEKIHDFYDGIKDKSILVANVDQSNELVKLENCLIKYKESLAKTSRTAKLWLQYIEYVETEAIY